MLQDFATCCQRMLRTEDLCARTGGEEFFILLPNTTMAAAHAIAERIRVESAACQVSPEHPQLRITASFGVADMGTADANFGAIFSRADRALYAAKQAGRNRVCLLPAEPAHPLATPG